MMPTRPSKEDIESAIGTALLANPKHLGIQQAPLKPEHLPDCQWVVVNAREYADIRKWGRDVLDIETGGERFHGDILCHYQGAWVVARRLVPVGTVFFVGQDGEVSSLHVKR